MPKEFGGFFKRDQSDNSSTSGNGTKVTLDDFFGVKSKRSTPVVKEIDLSNLIPFRGEHPFKPYSEDAMRSLVDDIHDRGLDNPIIVRQIDDDEPKYEILAGHNRVEAVKRAGFTSVQSKVVDVDDNNAMLIVVNSNLEQRQKLLPSEKAYAYKQRIEVMKNQGKRTDLLYNEGGTLESETSCKVCTKLNSGEILAEKQSNSRRNIYDYIRLTNLTKPLLNFVDDEAIAIMTGVNLSFLSVAMQNTVHEILTENPQIKLTLEMSKQLKELYTMHMLNITTITDVLFGRHGKKKKSNKEVVYSVKATKDFGKYLKRATKKRPLSQTESDELLSAIKQLTDEFIKNLDD